MTRNSGKPAQEHGSGGLAHAIGAYGFWGLLPLYLRLVHDVPPMEFVGWRTLFTLPVCAFILAAQRKGGALLDTLANRKVLATLCLSSLLIGSNWLIYVMAIQAGHLLAASLGYYINPLANVLLGTLFLGEKLSRRQWLAVALAAIGVVILAVGARETLWISLALAFSFSLYGLMRKLIAVEALPGLTVEVIVLILPALGLIALGKGSGGIALGHDLQGSLLIAISGVVTGVPLLMFTQAARRMDYSTLGFIQFMTPTLVFLLGLFVFHEQLRPVQLACFVLIWAAIGVFCWDLWAKRAAARN